MSTSPADITAAVVASFAQSEDPRLRQIMESLAQHIHDFVTEVELTEAEWKVAIDTLTATGHITDDKRQEWILWSDSMGVSMLVDALSHRLPPGATESTVLGPFFVPGSPLREYGEKIDEAPAGEAAWVYGTVRSLDGTPIPGAELDVWQNGDDELYAVQNPEVPEDHLRGRFIAREDGTFGFVGVRPTPYPIPFDGPVGKMLSSTGRHPWRPAHIHVIVRAPGHETLTTHIFDRQSKYIDSDAVFAVKPSLFRDFQAREADDPERPEGIEGSWWSLETNFVLAPADDPREPIDHGRTA